MASEFNDGDREDLIAATAELASLTVLHFDKDFELISKLTGQAAERLRA